MLRQPRDPRKFAISLNDTVCVTCFMCLSVQRHNVCTSFDTECVSVHDPPVRPMSVSSTSFVPLSLLCSPTTPHRIVTLTMKFSLDLTILPTKFHRNVSAIAESWRSCLGKGSAGIPANNPPRARTPTPAHTHTSAHTHPPPRAHTPIASCVS